MKRALLVGGRMHGTLLVVPDDADVRYVVPVPPKPTATYLTTSEAASEPVKIEQVVYEKVPIGRYARNRIDDDLVVYSASELNGTVTWRQFYDAIRMADKALEAAAEERSRAQRLAVERRRWERMRRVDGRDVHVLDSSKYYLAEEHPDGSVTLHPEETRPA